MKNANVYTFDWRALQRWGFKESDLPPESVVLYRKPTAWELYKSYIIGSIVLLLLQTLLIFALVQQRARRRKAETELGVTYGRLRQAVEAGKTLGWDWDVKTGRDRWFGDLQTIFGIQSDSHSGRVEDFHRLIHPEDRALVGKAIADARQSRKPYAAEFRVVRLDGIVRWITARGQFYYDANGDAERMLGMSVDITERKQAEQALKKSEEKFSKAFRESPMALTLTTVKDHRYLDVNETFEQLSGWRREEVIGRTPFELNIWLDPAKRRELARRIQTEGAVRNMEVQFRRKEGTWRIGLGSAELIEIEGEPCILSVIADVTERKQAEEALRASEQRLRLAVQAGRMYADEWDAASDIIVRSPEYVDILGSDEPVQTTLRELMDRIHRDDRDQVAAEFARMTPDNPICTARCRFLRHDGTTIWLERRARAFFDDKGKMQRMVSVVADITERKQAEQSLRESEERFRLVANTAPVMIWMAGTDKLCTYCNQTWLEFTGRPLETQLGNGWAEGVHPEDLNQCLDIYTQAFDRREPARTQYRLRRSDGEYRWISDIGVPRFDSDGSFAGYIGSCLDITDRKLAEETLASVSRRLIEAHEEERTWIARELHDDVNQRIALLAIKLDQWNHLPGSGEDTHQHIQTISQGLLEVGRDIQALSHRLHSSKLEYLGLAAAAKSFCKELSEQRQVQIDFSHSDIPHNLPKEIGLCLFRVLQEALQNAAKHSGVQQFKVEIRGTPGEIQLSVSDFGVGFDWQDAINHRGLGLISMRERLQLVSGGLSITSEPDHGTTIYARVPIRAEDLLEENRRKAG